MRSKIAKIAARAEMLPATKGTPIVIQWQEFSGVPSTDALTGEPIGEAIERTATIKGWVHFIAPTKTGYRVHQEMEVGDALLELPASIDLTGKKDVVFVIDGQEYVQKEVGKVLTQCYDSLIQGQKLFRTLLVTRRL
jgi:hypothetical protein